MSILHFSGKNCLLKSNKKNVIFLFPCVHWLFPILLAIYFSAKIEVENCFKISSFFFWLTRVNWPFSNCLLSIFFSRVDERSSDCYIGRDAFFMVFFSEKVIKFVQAQTYFFAVWLLICFQFSSFPLFKERQTPLSNCKSIEATKTGSTSFQKWNLSFRFPSEIFFYLLIQFSKIGSVLAKKCQS